MYKLLEQIDKLEGYELIQFFLAVFIAGLGVMLVVNAILHPELPFEL